jgi:hypothetical protein
MFLRMKSRVKDGKEHRYWSIVENHRVTGGRVVQRHVLYLGEINDSQREAWWRSIDILENGKPTRTVSLSPEDRPAPPTDRDVIHVRVNQMRLEHPRQWGACWMALLLWDQLQLDSYWAEKLPSSPEGTRWLTVLKILVCYRLIKPGSEWRLHRIWYGQSAMGDLLGEVNELIPYQNLDRDQLLMKVGAAKKEAGRAAGLVKITLPSVQQPVSRQTFRFRLCRDKLRKARRHEGQYLLRANLCAEDPALLWKYYMLLVEVEETFKTLKMDLSVRPIDHQKNSRIEAHIFVAFLAYALQVTPKQRLQALAPGLTVRSVMEKFVSIQMIDVYLPTTDGNNLLLRRYTQPDKDQLLLLSRLNLNLPDQPSPQLLDRRPDMRRLRMHV